MSEIAKGLGNAGPLRTIKWKGKDLQVHYFDTFRGEVYSAWAYESALRKLRVIVKDHTSEEYITRAKEIERRYDNNEYDLLSPIGQQIFKTATGSSKVLSIVLDMDDGEVIQFMTSYPEESARIINWVITDSYPELPKVNPPEQV